MTADGASETPAQTRLVAAIQQLGAAHGNLAGILANLTSVVAEEAAQNAAFATRLNAVLTVNGGISSAVVAPQCPPSPVAAASNVVSARARPGRGRRATGPWDPYAVYAEVGQLGLTERLNQLELEQLRDIVAEHGMNSDGLALRWKKADRVVSRIVERVVDRAAKGDAFRGA